MKAKKALREIVLFLVGLGFVGLATAAIIVAFRGSVSSGALFTITPNPTIPPGEPTTLAPYPYPIENLLTPNVAATRTAVMQLFTKEAFIETYLAITRSPVPPVTPVPTGTVEDNIYQRSSGSKLGITTLNGWVGYVDGNEVSLYVGALEWDPDQGAFYLFFSIPNDGFNKLILTPTKHGGVRVVSEQNNRLMLVSTDGTIYYFDLPSMRFVDSLTEVVPTMTPLPTDTPVPPPPTIDFSFLTRTPTPIPTYDPYLPPNLNPPYPVP